ncbi:hypothetical protein J7K41_00605 [Candidatus Micrarchaeota archaeon]|nr:hypothetical protein [Candidatus Micrarchaeota archaeon]
MKKMNMSGSIYGRMRKIIFATITNTSVGEGGAGEGIHFKKYLMIK